jgi:hypothetical protein
MNEQACLHTRHLQALSISNRSSVPSSKVGHFRDACARLGAAEAVELWKNDAKNSAPSAIVALEADNVQLGCWCVTCADAKPNWRFSPNG